MYASVSRNSNWALSSSSIIVNKQSTPTLKTTRTVIFDSGTSNIVLPQSDTEVGFIHDHLALSGWLSSRQSMLLYPLRFNQILMSQGHTESRAAAWQVYLRRYPSPLRRSRENHSTSRFRAMNWALGLSSQIPHCARHSSMQMSFRWLVEVCWNTIIVFGMSVTRGWDSLRMVSDFWSRLDIFWFTFHV